MKVHTVLQALSRWQAHRRNLRVKCKDNVFGTFEADNVENLLSVKRIKRENHASDIREIMSVKAEVWYL